jgi:hypothetical protein
MDNIKTRRTRHKWETHAVMFIFDNNMRPDRVIGHIIKDGRTGGYNWTPNSSIKREYISLGSDEGYSFDEALDRCVASYVERIGGVYA